MSPDELEEMARSLCAAFRAGEWSSLTEHTRDQWRQLASRWHADDLEYRQWLGRHTS